MRMRFAGVWQSRLAAAFFAGAALGRGTGTDESHPELIEAAKKEGKIVWYTSVELELAEKVAKAFEAKYPGIPVQVERSGAERNFQRLSQNIPATSRSRFRQQLGRGAFHRLETPGLARPLRPR